MRVFSVNEGVTLNLNKLTVADGNASIGGGIFVDDNATLIASNSTISGNTASGGGVGVFGGGIHNRGTLTVSNSAFSDNSAGDGGGIYNAGGTVTLSNSSFSGNHTIRYLGGGIYNHWGSMTVSTSTFSGNNAFTGGGVLNGDGGWLTVSNSTFSDNIVWYGGGIANFNVLTVSNSSFSGNSASNDGGGIRTWEGTVEVSNSTFSDNSAYDGGGGDIHNSGGTLTLKNTIVANSPTGTNCFGIITDGGGNLSYPDSTCPGINSDPVLGPLQNNGGPTETMALGPGSAAIDAANDATCAAPPVNNLDQRGVIRPQGAHCDIGAFEWVCPSFVPPAQVGVEDIVAMTTRWGWTSSTPGWDAAYDLNLDSKIDIVDIMLVTSAWGYTCS